MYSSEVIDFTLNKYVSHVMHQSRFFLNRWWSQNKKREKKDIGQEETHGPNAQSEFSEFIFSILLFLLIF